MPYCSVMSCRNHSKDVNVSTSNVSYHRFPEDIPTKEKWIDATGRDNWVPSKHHTICSEHFSPKDIIISSKKGYRYIKSNAVPTQKIVFSKANSSDLDVSKNITGVQKSSGEPEEDPLLIKTETDKISNFDNAELTSGTSKRPSTCDNSKESALVSGRKVTTLLPRPLSEGLKRDESPSSESSPSTQRMERKLEWAEIKAKRQELKIKRLQAQNRRLKKKMKTLQHILLLTHPSKICLKNRTCS